MDRTGTRSGRVSFKHGKRCSCGPRTSGDVPAQMSNPGGPLGAGSEAVRSSQYANGEGLESSWICGEMVNGQNVPDTLLGRKDEPPAQSGGLLQPWDGTVGQAGYGLSQGSRGAARRRSFGTKRESSLEGGGRVARVPAKPVRVALAVVAQRRRLVRPVLARVD